MTNPWIILLCVVILSATVALLGNGLGRAAKAVAATSARLDAAEPRIAALEVAVGQVRAVIDLPWKLTPVGDGGWWVDGPDGRWGRYDLGYARQWADQRNGEHIRKLIEAEEVAG